MEPSFLHPSSEQLDQAAALMRGFAERTGLISQQPQRRYLWTDAFAVCNCVGLSLASGRPEWEALATELVESVHLTLGRHRQDDGRTGPLSGLSEAEARLRPTCGGLRIGKKLPERLNSEPWDDQLEWERDGQYFHYLTKWMYALDQLARLIRQPQFNRWARELAEVAHARFRVSSPSGLSRLVWKMSIDLSRPLVTSTGMHDALDGYLTCALLQSTAREFGNAADAPNLEPELQSFAAMLGERRWATADPLGLGGLLMDAARVGQLVRGDALAADDLLGSLLQPALAGLQHFAQLRELEQPAAERVPFRELGLALGLSAVELVRAALRAEPRRFSRLHELERLVDRLSQYTPLGARIVSFWSAPEPRMAQTWLDHLDINEVMLATSLAPAGALVLHPSAHD